MVFSLIDFVGAFGFKVCLPNYFQILESLQ
jgi:hypothetical protein